MGTSFVENLPKKLLFAFSPTKLLTSSTRFIASVYPYGRRVSSDSLIWNLRLFPASSFSLVLHVMLKKKDRSLTTFGAGIAKISFPRIQSLLKRYSERQKKGKTDCCTLICFNYIFFGALIGTKFFFGGGGWGARAPLPLSLLRACFQLIYHCQR